MSFKDDHDPMVNRHCACLEKERDEWRSLAESLETYRSQLAKRVQKLEAVARAAPRECICHVRSFDGYYGANHTEACRALTDALAALEAEDDRPSQTQAPGD